MGRKMSDSSLAAHEGYGLSMYLRRLKKKTKLFYSLFCGDSLLPRFESDPYVRN